MLQVSNQIVIEIGWILISTYPGPVGGDILSVVDEIDIVFDVQISKGACSVKPEVHTVVGVFRDNALLGDILCGEKIDTVFTASSKRYVVLAFHSVIEKIEIARA